MNTLKVRYVIFCLWAFSLPQLSNVFHFVIIPHEFSIAEKQSVEWIKVKKGHYCEQHWFDLITTLPTILVEEILINRVHFSYSFEIIKEIYLKSFDFIRFLRGPPIEQNYPEFKI